MKLESQHESKDGTLKILWKLGDGYTVESVILPRQFKQKILGRNTACLSSQVGCAMACDFCQTGKQGLTRNLTADEIIAQVVNLNKIKPITNLVFMGMGEPLQNIENVVTAIDYFLSPKGLKLSRRKIIVSTSGVTHALDKLSKTGVKLAISLNATTDELRSQLMPINLKYSIKVLIEAAKKYGQAVKQPVMIEYILLNGLNTSIEDSKRLIALASGWDCKVNLIPYNTFTLVNGSESPYFRPDPQEVKKFQHALVSNGITATVRYSGGDDIYAACGQLKSLDALSKRGFSPPKQ